MENEQLTIILGTSVQLLWQQGITKYVFGYDMEKIMVSSSFA